jgi:hypothetical protein
MLPDGDPQPKAVESAIPSHFGERAQEMLAYFCNHLVALCGSYVELDAARQEVGEPVFFSFPGFILSVRGVWCLVTAGHSIQGLDDDLQSGRIRLTDCSLADYFGSAPRVNEPTRFFYEDCPKLSIHEPDDGLDFALIVLRPYYRMNLEANGIRAIAEENWINQNVKACELFALVGFPTCQVDNPRTLNPFGDRVAGTVNPTLVPVFPVKLHPEEVPRATFPWFIAEVGAAARLLDIDGMSGGPVFGFFQDSSGEWRYWIVAVQSRWRQDRRILFACPVPVLAGLVEVRLKRYQAEHTNQEPHGAEEVSGEQEQA